MRHIGVIQCQPGQILMIIPKLRNSRLWIPYHLLNDDIRIMDSCIRIASLESHTSSFRNWGSYVSGVTRLTVVQTPDAHHDDGYVDQLLVFCFDVVWTLVLVDQDTPSIELLFLFFFVNK
ncbi:hypothetical protein PGT21_028834 [Puccinia graminis f. sp. tritici]|uniref:Uncharacterized protein n=1 Tax=Puccinia graminis f. sp. tritici TaxID=56615 RepID=A0A5B0QCK8_PUCGR|nr:hypothetical protein PGT21_028834 [Puccinia graminis f. sp. tritici]